MKILKFTKNHLVLLTFIGVAQTSFAFQQADNLNSSSQENEVTLLKQEIINLAESYSGQGDPDRSKQKSLEVLVQRLLELNPQAPIEERLPFLYGAWKQVWGPYEYRKNDRSVDPTLDPTEIYQVVSEGGYYYNVNPSLDRHTGKRKNITLLRGAFTVDEKEGVLNARFTNLRRVDFKYTKNLSYIDLPALSEQGKLYGQKTVLPAFFVRLFFGGGVLNEVYTDHDLRITFGSSNNNSVDNYIYILKRVDASEAIINP
jgi:hypothetical protein